MNTAEWIFVFAFGPVTVDLMIRTLLWVFVWPAEKPLYPKNDQAYIGMLCFWWLLLPMLIIATPFLLMLFLAWLIRKKRFE